MAELGLRGKRALITGGSRGIGRSAALLLAAEGADVAINYVANEQAAEDVVRRAGAHGVAAHALGADVSDPEQAARVVAEGCDRLGGLDVFVHSSGIGAAADATVDDWERMIRVQLSSTFYLCREVAPILREQGSGAMVVVGSIAARGTGTMSYHTAMAGKLCYTLGLARRLAPHGVRVNVVSPGQVMTDMTRDWLGSEEACHRFAQEKIPLYQRREGYPTADEVGKVILFLVSDLASHVTGADVPVNGGQQIQL